MHFLPPRDRPVQACQPSCPFHGCATSSRKCAQYCAAGALLPALPRLKPWYYYGQHGACLRWCQPHLCTRSRLKGVRTVVRWPHSADASACTSQTLYYSGQQKSVPACLNKGAVQNTQKPTHEAACAASAPAKAAGKLLFVPYPQQSTMPLVLGPQALVPTPDS